MSFLFSLWILFAAQARAEPPCPRLVFAGEEIGLDKAEKRLVCGDPDSEAWSKVPAAQARAFLRVILQNRGYHAPTFRADGQVLTVDIGTRTVVTDFLAEGLPVDVDPGKQRRFVGEALTPKLLDRAEAALSAELRQRGYACPELEARGEPRSGVIRAHAAPGELARLDRIVDPPIPGIDTRIFRRYEAFRRGQLFDERLLAVTADRIVREALFLSAFFDVDCGTRPAAVVLRAVSAPPQIVRVGVGIDSEGLARVRAQWQHSRIGGRASSMETTLHGSVREQSFESFLRLYPGPASRVHLRPRVYIARIDEARFETVGAQLSVAPALNWDFETLGVQAKAGPAVDDVRTVRGLGIPRETYLSWETHVSILSHLYERYLADPRSGWQTSVAMSSRFAGAYSEFTAHRLKFSYQALWNVGLYEPPLLVLGSRGLAAATWTLDQERTLALLPPAYRHYLGGDADYRGLGRGELPGEALGYLSAVYHGLELRMGDLLPGRLQPYVFFDTAMGGGRRFQLSPDLYYAPGMGVRWPSPVGTLRGSVARGFVRHSDPATVPVESRLQFYFSFGREF
ncbi:MAG: BamA/TamA family outer membrane protein [Elusimicrobiota bacterium]|nr:BamA/TamA family outer membrane protein [Elusimicrobiota bacterium]